MPVHAKTMKRWVNPVTNRSYASKKSAVMAYVREAMRERWTKRNIIGEFCRDWHAFGECYQEVTYGFTDEQMAFVSKVQQRYYRMFYAKKTNQPRSA